MLSMANAEDAFHSGESVAFAKSSQTGSKSPICTVGANLSMEIYAQERTAAVTFAKQAPEAVIRHKITAYAIETDELNSDAVITSKLADGAVTSYMFVDGAVT